MLAHQNVTVLHISSVISSFAISVHPTKHSTVTIASLDNRQNTEAIRSKQTRLQHCGSTET